METLTTLTTLWLYVILTLLSPPERRPSWVDREGPAAETLAEAHVRYASIAADMQAVVWSEPPLPGRTHAETAALVASVAFFESGFRKDVDFGVGKYGRGDNGGSWCLMQRHVGKDGEYLVQDRRRCLREGLRVMRQSLAACGDLSAYTNGHCVKGDKSARNRQALATRIMSRLSPPQGGRKDGKEEK